MVAGIVVQWCPAIREGDVMDWMQRLTKAELIELCERLAIEVVIAAGQDAESVQQHLDGVLDFRDVDARTQQGRGMIARLVREQAAAMGVRLPAQS
jgi:hypothetical protein